MGSVGGAKAADGNDKRLEKQRWAQLHSQTASRGSLLIVMVSSCGFLALFFSDLKQKTGPEEKEYIDCSKEKCSEVRQMSLFLSFSLLKPDRMNKRCVAQETKKPLLALRN